METLGYWWTKIRRHGRFDIPGCAESQVRVVSDAPRLALNGLGLILDLVQPDTPCARRGRSQSLVRAIWLVALVLCAQMLWVGEGWAQGVAQERRTALVIGNSAYQRSPLVNPVNDAQAMAATLGTLGFTVTRLENASKSQMADAIRKFGDTIKRGGVGLFYFAGHGVQVNGENFLIPVDDDIQDKSQVSTKGIEAKLVLQAMSNAKNRLNVVILDACRNNPFAQSANRALVPTGNTD